MSVNLAGLVPHKVLRFGGLCEWDDALVVPGGLALFCENLAFLAESVKTRWGLRNTTSAAADVGNATGADVLTVLGNPTFPGVQQGPGGGRRFVSNLQRSRLGFQAHALTPRTP